MGRGAKRGLLAAAAAVVAAAAIAGGPSAAVDRSGAATAESWAVPGELLVRFRANAPAGRIAAVHESVGAEAVQTLDIVPNLQLVRLDPGTTVADAVGAYASRDDVLYAQPNFVYRVDRTPNDPLYPQLWNLNNRGQGGGTPDADVDAPEAWEVVTGSDEVVVGVLDTGVDYRHKDLRDRTKPNTAECNGTPGADDDSNGYVDDCHGIDAVNGDSDPLDDNNHGTHVSGTIGATGDNGIGIAGINWRVTILACKSHKASGNGTTAALLECLQYMETMKAEGLNIVATNNSYGGCPEACDADQALEDAISSNMSAGILFVASAGNNGADNDATRRYPSGYFLPNIVAVAASSRHDLLAGFSNYGERTVHVAAPGVQVKSTIRRNRYRAFSGTSMSAPHVTGLAALLAAQNPSLSWDGLRNLILAGGDPLTDLDGATVTGRRINAFGSATCSDRTLFGVLRPLGVQPGRPIPIAALNIVCADASSDALSVTITPGGAEVPLEDGGTGGDQVAGDGIFAGEWAPDPCVPGDYTFSFSNGESASATITC